MEVKLDQHLTGGDQTEGSQWLLDSPQWQSHMKHGPDPSRRSTWPTLDGLRLCLIRTCVVSSGERRGPCSWVPVSVQTSSTPKPCQAVGRTVLQAMGDVRGESETHSFSPSSFSKCFPTTLCQGLCWGVWDTSEDKTQQHGLVELIFWQEQIANKQHT